MKIVRIIFCLVPFLYLSCKKNNTTLQNTNSINKASDTLIINKENCYISFTWDSNEIETYKTKFKNDDNFYTAMDDVNFYTAEGEECLKKSGLEKITIDKKKYKYIKFRDNNFLKIDTLKFFDKIIALKNEKPKIIKPIDLVFECKNISKEKLNSSLLESKPINAFTPKNYDILTKAEYDWDGDKIQDIIIVYDSIPSISGEGIGKRPLIALKGKGNNQFEFWFRNDDAIPCRSCSGSADPDIELKIKNGNLQYRDISLISSTVKNIGYSFDNNFDLVTIDIDIEDSGAKKKKTLTPKNKLPKANLKTINLRKIESEVLNY